MRPHMREFTIDARTLPAPVDGFESSGRQIPTFYLSAFDAISAAWTARKVLMAAHPDIASVHVVATETDPGDRAAEQAVETEKSAFTRDLYTE